MNNQLPEGFEGYICDKYKMNPVTFKLLYENKYNSDLAAYTAGMTHGRRENKMAESLADRMQLCKDRYNDIPQCLIDEARELENKMTESWVSAKDRLPEKLERGQYKRYIVAVKSGGVFECSWLFNSWHHRHDGCSERTDVTHWRELPSINTIHRTAGEQDDE